MNLNSGTFKEWWRRQLQPTPRSGKLLGYIFAWLMVTSAIRIAFFRYESFWPTISSTLIALFIGDYIGSKTYPSFKRFVHKIQTSRN
jgi:hypothetical protein